MTIKEENSDRSLDNQETEKVQLEQTLQEMKASDELDRSFIVIEPHLWIAHLTILFISLLVLVWAFFGSISIKIEGKGIFIDKEGLYSVESKIPGIVQSLKVKQGNYVKKGEILLEVIDPEQELKLTLAEVRSAAMQKDLDRLKNEIASEKAKQREAILSKIKATEFTISQTEEEVANLKKDLNLRKNLIQEGLLSPTKVREAENDLSGKENSLATEKSNLVSLYSDLEKGYRTQEYNTKEEEFLKVKQERDLLQLTKNFAQVLSPFDGYVVDVLVNQGDRVTAGGTLILLEHRKNIDVQPPLIVYGFVSVDLGKRIRAGLPVQMETSTFSAVEFGKMLGTVTAISEFAVSPEHLAKLIHNQTLVDYLMQNNKAVIQLEIEPLLDPSTPSGYKWTTRKGPPVPITSGTVCTINAIVEKVRPFYFIFPLDEFRNVFYFQTDDQKSKKSSDIEESANIENQKKLGFHFLISEDCYG